MAVTIRALGTPAAGNGAVTPAIPAGAVVGDVLVLKAGARAGTSEIAEPTGWDRLVGPDTDTSDSRSFSYFVRKYQSGDSNPTLASVGDAQCGCITALAGADYDGTQASLVHEIGARWRSSGSQNIGPITSVESPAGGLIMYGGFKGDDYTSVATLTGDSLTWTELFEAFTTAGNDGGMVGGAAETPSLITPTNKTFTVTGGGSTAGMGRCVSFKPAAAGDIEMTLTPVVESDVVQALTKTQQAISVSITPVTESDTTQSLSLTQAAIQKAITAALEADEAVALTFTQPGGEITVSITPVTETDAVQALGFSQAPITITLTPALETDATQGLAYTQAAIQIAISPALETDEAVALSVAGAEIVRRLRMLMGLGI